MLRADLVDWPGSPALAPVRDTASDRSWKPWRLRKLYRHRCWLALIRARGRPTQRSPTRPSGPRQVGVGLAPHRPPPRLSLARNSTRPVLSRWLLAELARLRGPRRTASAWMAIVSPISMPRGPGAWSSTLIVTGGRQPMRRSGCRLLARCPRHLRPNVNLRGRLWSSCVRECWAALHLATDPCALEPPC